SRAATSNVSASVAAQPVACLALGFGDLGLAHLAGDLHAVALGFRIAARSREIEPHVRTHQVERNLNPYAVHKPHLKQSIRRAATWGELDGLYDACIKSCHDTGLCLPRLPVCSESSVDGGLPLDA